MLLLGVRAGFLALIAGSADAAGWLGSGIFAAHMTGNTAFLGIALAQGHDVKAGFRLLTIASAVAGFAAASLLLKRRGAVHRLPGGIAATLATGAAFLGHRPWDVVLLAAALAMQNATFRRFGGETININFLTGDLQKLASSLVSGKSDEGTRTQIRLVPVIWAGYVAAAAATALAFHHLAHPLLPSACCLWLLVLLPAAKAGTTSGEGTTSGASSPAR